MRSSLLALLFFACFTGCTDTSNLTGGDDAAPDDLTAAASSCKDGVKNGAETDIDCGGSICPACGAGKGCAVAGDCQSGNCLNSSCLGAGGELGTLSDLAMTPDMAMSPVIDMSSVDMAVSIDMSANLDMTMPVGTACTFDDPNSLFDDCVVGP